MESLIDILSHEFIQRSLFVGVLVCLCAALLGVSLVLKRYSMIGDGLSHVGFGAVGVALALNLAPMYIAVPVMIVASFFLLRLSENGKIKGDAAVAVVSSSAIAVGITSVSFAQGSNVDIESYMFGSILSVSKSDMYLSCVLSVIVIFAFIFLYNKLFTVTFDENAAAAGGINIKKYNVLLALLTAITIVIGMRLMGTLLISGLIVFPALTSMRLFRSYRGVVISSAVVSVTCFVCGFFFSYLFSAPVGGSVIIVNLIVFIAANAVRLVRR